jgi:hypothetical protein
MSSKNLRNKELEFTQTFGNQLIAHHSQNLILLGDSFRLKHLKQ